MYVSKTDCFGLLTCACDKPLTGYFCFLLINTRCKVDMPTLPEISTTPTIPTPTKSNVPLIPAIPRLIPAIIPAISLGPTPLPSSADEILHYTPTSKADCDAISKVFDAKCFGNFGTQCIAARNSLQLLCTPFNTPASVGPGV